MHKDQMNNTNNCELNDLGSSDHESGHQKTGIASIIYNIPRENSSLFSSFSSSTVSLDEHNEDIDDLLDSNNESTQQQGITTDPTSTSSDVVKLCSDSSTEGIADGCLVTLDDLYIMGSLFSSTPEPNEDTNSQLPSKIESTPNGEGISSSSASTSLNISHSYSDSSSSEKGWQGCLVKPDEFIMAPLFPYQFTSGNEEVPRVQFKTEELSDVPITDWFSNLGNSRWKRESISFEGCDVGPQPLLENDLVSFATSALSFKMHIGLIDNEQANKKADIATPCCPECGKTIQPGSTIDEQLPKDPLITDIFCFTCEKNKKVLKNSSVSNATMTNQSYKFDENWVAHKSGIGEPKEAVTYNEATAILDCIIQERDDASNDKFQASYALLAENYPHYFQHLVKKYKVEQAPEECTKEAESQQIIIMIYNHIIRFLQITSENVLELDTSNSTSLLKNFEISFNFIRSNYQEVFIDLINRYNFHKIANEKCLIQKNKIKIIELADFHSNSYLSGLDEFFQNNVALI